MSEIIGFRPLLFGFELQAFGRPAQDDRQIGLRLFHRRLRCIEIGLRPHRFHFNPQKIGFGNVTAFQPQAVGFGDSVIMIDNFLGQPAVFLRLQ